MERYYNEILTDNTSLNHYAQCETCLYRYSNYFIFEGKRYDCDDSHGWKKRSCQLYIFGKPDYVYDNALDCEEYEKDPEK